MGWAAAHWPKLAAAMSVGGSTAVVSANDVLPFEPEKSVGGLIPAVTY